MCPLRCPSFIITLWYVRGPFYYRPILNDEALPRCCWKFMKRLFMAPIYPLVNITKGFSGFDAGDNRCIFYRFFGYFVTRESGYAKIAKCWLKASILFYRYKYVVLCLCFYLRLDIFLSIVLNKLVGVGTYVLVFAINQFTIVLMLIYYAWMNANDEIKNTSIFILILI